jgi:nitrite reductase/ring-hydroxylating ferredoxin subunit
MRICPLADLDDPGARAFKVGDGNWPLRAFVVRDGASVRAYVNRCPHAGHPLDLVPGRFLSGDGQTILCSSHAAEFTIADGVCVAGPCPGRSLQRLPIEVRDGAIWLAEAFRLQDYEP